MKYIRSNWRQPHKNQLDFCRAICIVEYKNLTDWLIKAVNTKLILINNLNFGATY